MSTITKNKPTDVEHEIILPEPCPGCGRLLDEKGCDVNGAYHHGPGGCANEHPEPSPKRQDYQKCQQAELLNAIRRPNEPIETGSCDRNATKSVNLPDREYMDDHNCDRLFWVCAEDFERHYHSYIMRGENGECDCAACRGFLGVFPCDGCGRIISAISGRDSEGVMHYASGDVP